MVSEIEVSTLNLGRHDLLKNKNKIQSTPIPHLHARELHVSGGSK
jgi:hypothetical protein